jgi:glutamate:Na+ symporter, ESS family
LKIGAVETLALAGVALLLGTWLRRLVPLLTRLNIPSSIVGGLVFALANWMARSRGWLVDFDTSLRDPLMLACFSIIGFNASWRVLRQGGQLIALLLALSAAGAMVQNLLGIGLARLFGLNPLIGILAGSVSLAGGPATSQAFGAVFEALGVPAAAAIALASATFGIAISGWIAGALGGMLVRRTGVSAKQVQSSSGPAIPAKLDMTMGALSSHALWIVLALGIGAVVSRSIASAGFVMPAYIGAMTIAAILRNCDDRWSFARFSGPVFSEIFTALLPLFISAAMLTLRIWELERLAIPLLVILIVQVVVTTGFCAFAFFALRRGPGNAYDGAVSSAGLCGFMLGITPNAMASMQELAEKYGPAPRAFLAVPVVGGFLLDFANSLLITATISVLKLLN